MKFQDRLDLLNETKSPSKKGRKSSSKAVKSDVFDIFVRDEKAEELIFNALKQSQNIVVAASVNTDKTIISQYIEKFILDVDSYKIISNIQREFKSNETSKIILPESDVVSFVKVLEHILCGYKGFVVGLNIKTYENILVTLKTLISLYFNNLTKENIDNLLGISDSLIVYFSKNEDGLFYVSEIGQITFDDNVLGLIDLYPQVSKKEKTVEKELYVEEPKIEEPTVKVNKYKLLKEKAKKKKAV